jgi:hypothetical protein
VSHHLDLLLLRKRLQRSTSLYTFEVLDPIHLLPEPTEEPAQGKGFSPQFNPHALFLLLESHPERRRTDFVVGVIDSEVYNELFSTINPLNDSILISLRTRTLPLILQKSGRSITNYVGLELAAQLLCIQYRSSAGATNDPTQCNPPWHIQRLNCLFDWFGISPTNVTKLLRPSLSPFARQYFAQASVPATVVDDGVEMARYMTRLDARAVFSQLAPDPFLAVVMGALVGWAASFLTSANGPWGQIVFASIAVLVVGWRVYVLLTDKSRI